MQSYFFFEITNLEHIDSLIVVSKSFSLLQITPLLTYSIIPPPLPHSISVLSGSYFITTYIKLCRWEPIIYFCFTSDKVIQLEVRIISLRSMILFLKLLILKYQNKSFRGYFNLKSCNICKSRVKLLNVKASVCVSLDGVGVSLKNYLKY